MNGAAVMADVPPAIAPPASLLASYNLSLSLNLSSILSMLPSSGSRLLARLRKGTFGTLLWDPEDAPPTSVWASTLAEATATGSAATPLPSEIDRLSTFPGPWGFFTSWYMVGLFIMAVLLHRMQNVVLPSRLPPRRSRHAYRFGPSFSQPLHHRIHWRRLYTSFLPLDFSRTTTRLILHLPSAYFLGMMLLTWFCLVLQTSEMFPAFGEDQVGRWVALGWVNQLGKWVARKEMSDVCWQTFVAVCGAFLVEGFVRALVGLGTGFPIGSHDPNTSPFNLIGYAFLLHVYSSPIAHAYKPNDGLPSRPDKHVIITITIPLLQLFIFHILSISKRHSTHRLFPTLLSSVLSLAHFHGTLFSHFIFKSSSSSASLLSSSTANGSSITTAILASTALASSGSNTATTTLLATAAAATPLTTTSAAIPHRLSPYVTLPMPSIKYPLLNYIPNILETLLMLIILLTVCFNALVQLLLLGRVERLFSGMGIGMGSGLVDEDQPNPSFFNSLPLDEDWGVVLLRVGIASLEATGLRGWGNEVAPVHMPLPSSRHGRGRGRGRERGRIEGNEGASHAEVDSSSSYGVVRLGRGGVADVQHGISASGSSSARAVQMSSRRRIPYNDTPIVALPTRNRGFLNEVRTVDLGNSEDNEHAPNSNHHPRRRGNRRRRGGFWRRWAREMVDFLLALWGVLRGLVALLIERAKERIRGVRKTGTEGSREREDPGSLSSLPLLGEGRVGDASEGWREEEERVEEARRRRKEREVYERFLRGEEISDDDEDVDVVSSEEEDEEEEEDGSNFEEEGDADREAEAIGLFTDLLRNPNPPNPLPGSSRASGASLGGGSGEMVLAHLVHSTTPNGGGSPLTRRRWNALFNNSKSGWRRRGSPGVWSDEYEDEDAFWGGDDDSALERPEQDRRRVEGTQQVQSTCVICTTEARDIICWPCRCLAMCDSCREALASKSAPSKHRCPCCRQTVDGYSRIYIP